MASFPAGASVTRLLSTAEDRVDVTVAVTPPFTPVFQVGSGSPDQSSSWEELPKASFQVRGAETLRDVLRAAARRLDVSVREEVIRMEDGLAAERETSSRSDDIGKWLVFVGFRQADDDEVASEHEGLVVRNWASRIHGRVVVVREDEGRAMWRRPPFDATIEELLDAHDAGLIDGDPRQIYLVPSIPQGDLGLGGEWQTFVTHLKILWEATDVLARVGGAASALVGLKALLDRRSQKAIQTIEHRGGEWTERGASPADIAILVAAKPRTKEEIASLLGCSGEEAEAILWALGCTYDERTALWVSRGDPDAQLVADDVSLTFTDVLASGAFTEEFQRMVESRLRRFVETGNPPDLETDRRELRAEYFEGLDPDGRIASDTSSATDRVGVRFRLGRRQLRRWIRSRLGR